jgi:hypothetical protein
MMAAPEVLDPIAKWIDFLIATNFQELQQHKDPSDMFRSQGSINALGLLLAQIKNIRNRAKQEAEKPKE